LDMILVELKGVFQSVESRILIRQILFRQIGNWDSPKLSSTILVSD
jgi:hypothetical protein